MQKLGFLGVTFVCKWFKYCSTVSFQKKAYLWRSANLANAWKSFDSVTKSSDHFLGYFATMTRFSLTSNDKIVWIVAHNLTKSLIYKPSVSQIYRIQTFPSCCRKICIMVLWYKIISFQYLLKFGSKLYEILFAPWTIIFLNLTWYIQPNLYCLYAKASILCLQ